MAFTPKTWVGRSVQYPGRIRLVPTGEDGVFDVQRAEGEITADGDLVSDAALNDLEQRILTAILSKADGTGGAANNALALGGVAANDYVQKSISSTTLTLINGWTGALNYYEFGKVALIRIGNAPLTGGTANTSAAVLPSQPVGTLNDTGNGIQIKQDGGAWSVVPINASTAAWTFTVILLS